MKMITLHKSTINVFQLCFFLCALQMCYKIKSINDYIYKSHENEYTPLAINFLSAIYLDLKPMNLEKYENNNINANSLTNSLQSPTIWKSLIDDLLCFHRCNNYHNLAMYPLDIKNELTNSSTSSFSKNITNVSNWFDAVKEQNTTNVIYIKDRTLDNSFYDLHLNTAVNVSESRESFLKKDPFLQMYNDDSCDELSFYCGNLKQDITQANDQVLEMADVLYKQDVDLGYMLSPSSCKTLSSTQPNKNEEEEQVKAIQSLKDSKLAEILYQQDIDLGYIFSTNNSTHTSILNEIPSLNEDTLSNNKILQPNKMTVKEVTDTANDGWAGIPFKIDNETGEYIRLPLDDLLQDILPFADNCSNNEDTSKPDKNAKDNSGSNSLGDLDVSSDDISLIMQSFWPSTQDTKGVADELSDNDCRQDICGIAESEEKSLKMDPRSQDNASLFTPVLGVYGINPDITPYTHYHPHYSPKHSLHNPHREENYFQSHFAHNMDSSGSLGINNSYPNGEIHSIKHFASTPADLVPSEGFLSSLLNEECIQMMDISTNERSQACNEDGIIPVIDSNTVGTQSRVKSIEINNTLCASNITDRLDLSCDSAVSSLSSERVQSTSDSEWGEGSDSGHDFHQTNYYGPYDYSSSSRNFTSRQNPVVQKKYHMFGKRYFQEQTSQNSIIHSTIQFLHSTNTAGECDGIENMIENAEFDDCTEGMLSLSSVKTPSESIHSDVKSERDKFDENINRSQINANTIQHNHTYTLLHNSASNHRFVRDNSGCEEILPDGHLTRDEKRARNLKVPIPVPDIINLPMDEFNERISKYDLSENQLSLIRDIRRRGKNKVAAQNCRKRKLDQIHSLEGEVKEVRRRKEKLQNDRAFISTEKKRIANKFATLHQHIFQFLRDAEGNPCSPSKYSLQQASDGSIYLLPRDSSKLDPNYHMSILIDVRDASLSGSCRQRRMHHSYVRTNLKELPVSNLGQSQINGENKGD